MHSTEFLDELQEVIFEELAGFAAPIRVVVEVMGTQYDVSEMVVEWNAVPADRLLVIKAR